MSPAEKIKLEAQKQIRQRKLSDHEVARKSAATSTQKAQDLHLQRPIIVKTTESEMTGIRSFETARCAVGYVLAGHKYIYSGDTRSEAAAGDIFFLGKGRHYVEEVPAGKRKPFEQILFFYTPEQAGRIIAGLSIDHGVETHVRHTCAKCAGRNHVVEKGWEDMKIFFETIALALGRGVFDHQGISVNSQQTSQTVAMTMMFHNIIDRAEGCLRTKLLGSTDPEKELMERQINEYIFSDITLEDFARLHNRSITSFKKKFKEYFHEPPHRWVIRQRLMHARMRLLQSDKTVAQIGAECRFPNTSHFIKLFRLEFGKTPSAYRQLYRISSPNRVY